MYFNKDRNKKIKEQIDGALALLDAEPFEVCKYFSKCAFISFNWFLFSESSKKQKAEHLYLKGKCMDFLPEYTKQAEENLSKSIKLMPTKQEAWDALGHVFWKKRDLEQARKCFEGSLEQNENNKVALRNLSMVVR